MILDELYIKTCHLKHGVLERWRGQYDQFVINKVLSKVFINSITRSFTSLNTAFLRTIS